MNDIDKTIETEEDIEVLDIEETDSENDEVFVECNNDQTNTSIIRKQLIDNMDDAIANLDSSTETVSSTKQSKPEISERLTKSANVINCSLDKIISLARCTPV